MRGVTYNVQQNSTFVGETTLVGMVCPECGVSYAIPLRLRDEAWEKGHGRIQWYCPHGHKLGYHGLSEAEKERRGMERGCDTCERGLALLPSSFREAR